MINDVSGDVSNFFRILQRHYVPFLDLLRYQFTSRQEFDRLMATNALTLTDLERAVRFLYLQRTSYGGKVAGRSFGVSPSTPARFDVGRLAPLLADLNDRLAGVIIERLDFGEFIARYDAPGALFYCDPPYWGSEGDYGEGVFSRQDFDRLAVALKSLQSNFILSINDTPAVREIFAPFPFIEIELTYTIARGAAQNARELIIHSHDLPVQAQRSMELF